MPRASKAAAAQHHGAIERASSRLLRGQGLQVSVADVMGAAGLTHGGFYGHFRSKDELLAAGCARAFAESVERWRERTAAAPDRAAALAALIGGYLAADGPIDTGCPVASLATDVAREAPAKPVRDAFRAGLEGLLGILTGLQPRATRREARERALVQMCTMVGALVLARATRGRALSDELLTVARRRLLARDPAPAGRAPRRSGGEPARGRR